MTYPTIMPALTLDFQNSQQLDPRVTFSRSSSATYINSAGLVVSAADHEARFDHDGNGECLGLLIEESRTNLSEQSEDLNTWWIKHGGVTVTPNATQAPDGLSQADKLVSPNSSNRFSLYKWLALTANNTYTCSCFAKADEWNFFTIAVGKQGGPYTRASYTIDLTTGDVNQGPWQNTPASESFTKTKLSNGWWRLSVSVKVDSTSTDFQFEMGMSPTNQFNNGTAGDGSSGIYMWGAQIETSFPTSYIPTSGSTATRSEDIAQVSTADIYGDEFTIINKPFGVSSGSDTLHLQGYPHVERAAVYNENLSQQQINTVTGVDEFWQWRILGSSFALPNFAH